MSRRGVYIVVTGRVQGVCFRAAAVKAAKARGISGWVRNTAFGEVESIAEGEEGAVEEFIGWCRTGPDSARVDSVDIIEVPYTGSFTGFEVRD